MLNKTIFEKIALGKKLSPEEAIQFAATGERLQFLESLVGSGTESLSLRGPLIARPRWEGSPLHVLAINQNQVTAIPNTTNTYVTFDQSWNFGSAFTLSEDGTKVFINQNIARAFSLAGYATWAANATGYRGAWIEAFDSSDVSAGSMVLHTAAGNALVNNVIPISITWWFAENMKYLKFYVHQSSGGDLNLLDLQVGISVA